MALPSDLPPRTLTNGKPWLSLEDQVSKFEQRGLDLTPDERKQLEGFLATQNYYRFSGYFKQLIDTALPDTFRQGTTLEQLLAVYRIDSQIRLLIFQGVQVLEPIIRTRVAYRLADGGVEGPTYYLKKKAYEPSRPSNNPPQGMGSKEWARKHTGLVRTRDSLLHSIQETLGREELYLRHFQQREQDVPLWAMVEALSLGDLSKMVSTWKNTNQIERLMKDLGFRSAPELRRAVGNVNFFRNLSAHHNRLWGRRLTRTVALSPWKGNSLFPYEGAPTESPLHILRLLVDWVDFVQGNNDYSKRLWATVQEEPIYEEGMKNPRL
ncbi:MAG: Abi family protein [Rothia sp. (in: high G+C Gram-positive bacteria)]|nr:Abi family protein [Rothia sp. (in: high G+C Gram-positive bacteria)]